MRVLLEGIAPEHAAAFVAGLIAAIVVAALRGGSRSTVDRWAASLLAYAAAVHIFLPFGHQDGPGLTAALIADGAVFGALAWRAHVGRGWRIGTAILAPLTILAYLIRAEDGDQVATLTALAELTAFGLAVATSRKVGRVFGSVGTVFAVIVAGAAIWVTTFKAHQAASADAQDPSVGHSHAEGHEHLARAQAGVIMRPLGPGAKATAAQTAAAIALASNVKKAAAKYAKLSDALAAGYKYPLEKRTGMDVHMENPEYKKDGRTLDPERPEMLVYAIDGGRAVLMGVVFVMERAGEAGPDPGGPITRWHAHNLCISLTPPGIGIVTPFGGCPASSVTLTIPEMMHVWIVEPPGGPFAEGVDQAWAREYLEAHAIVL